VHRFQLSRLGSEFASDVGKSDRLFGSSSLFVWGLCWLLDFSVSSLLKISVSSLQAFLLALLAAGAIGAGVFLCS
jgi:hypothetical protein